ncbi:MAG: hypothetical protein HDQ91_04210 [Desulfovibrio sp.]|nr:hypothetical protein [Desulfovibrio sp.]
MKIWNASGYVPFELEILTPVHIGSGADFSPLEYVIQETGQGRHEVWLIDTAAWLAASAEDPRVARALDAGDMASLRSLLNGCASLAAFVLGRVPIASASLARLLLQKRNTVDSKAEIMAFARNPFTHSPYIPASSLKGAISTALTDYLNNERRGAGKPGLRQAQSAGEYRKIMEDMYGRIGEHSMQGLRMADIALGPGMTSVREATGEDLEPPKRLEKTPCETLEPRASGKVFGNLRLALCRGKPAVELRYGEAVSAEKLGRICNDFYRKRFQAELEKFYGRQHLQAVGEALRPVAGRIAALAEESEILLRVGRYSHYECVTVSGAPEPHPVKGPGLSRTLADHALPFGWIILRRCSLEKYQQGIAAVDAALREDIGQRARIGREARERQEEAERRAQAEAEAARKREEELASLSPREREIWELEQPDAIENQASAIYAKLAEYGELMPRAAEALMRFWQRAGKWEGKQLTKKQKEKVAAVRAILKI